MLAGGDEFAMNVGRAGARKRLFRIMVGAAAPRVAPTFASWAGVRPPGFVDGRSLAPLFTSRPPASWRSAFLVEHRRSNEEFGYVSAIPNYSAVRTARYNYV
jgi:arylsulfatase A-like enzyme